MFQDNENNAYWSANVRLILISLVIWALVSFGFGIILRPLLSGISLSAAPILASGSPSKARS